MHGWHQHISTLTSLKKFSRDHFCSVSVWDGPPDTAKGRAVEIPPGVLAQGHPLGILVHATTLMGSPFDRWMVLSMGDLQDPIDGGTLVPYVWPYFLGIFPYIGHWIRENTIKFGWFGGTPILGRETPHMSLKSHFKKTPGTCKRLPLLEIAARIEDHLNMVLCSSRFFNTPTYTNDRSFRHSFPRTSSQPLYLWLRAIGHVARWARSATWVSYETSKYGPVFPMYVP